MLCKQYIVLLPSPTTKTRRTQFRFEPKHRNSIFAENWLGNFLSRLEHAPRRPDFQTSRRPLLRYRVVGPKRTAAQRSRLKPIYMRTVIGYTRRNRHFTLRLAMSASVIGHAVVGIYRDTDVVRDYKYPTHTHTRALVVPEEIP